MVHQHVNAFLLDWECSEHVPLTVGILSGMKSLNGLRTNAAEESGANEEGGQYHIDETF